MSHNKLSIEDLTETQPEPYGRLLLAQAWSIASAFTSRYPDWAIRFGDHLSYLTIVNRYGDTRRVVANPGAIHLFNADSVHEIIPPLSVADPYESAKAIDQWIGESAHRPVAASTPRTLAYRFLAAALNVTINEKARWEVKNEILGDDGYGDGLIRAGMVAMFPDAARDASNTQSETWDLGEPLRHFWGIVRDDLPVALVSVEGRLYLPGRTVDMQLAYLANGRSMLPLIADLFGAILLSEGRRDDELRR